MKKAKITTSFVCQECGYDTTSWMGKCPECGTWNSLREFKTQKSNLKTQSDRGTAFESKKPQTLKEIAYEERSRIQTNYEELNTVLGGGIVKGSVILMAGDPGVGKSTLLLQLALSLSTSDRRNRLQAIPDDAHNEKIKKQATTRSLNESRPSTKVLKQNESESTFNSSGSLQSTPRKENSDESTSSLARKVLYVSGEESVEQIKMRAVRISTELKTENSKLKTTSEEENLYLVSMTDADAIVTQIEEMKPDLVIIDSIQTIESQNLSGLSGSVGQVRYCALQFVRVAKQYNIPIVIVGHVTKEGMVAGPMVLSHMVDTVLFLEGEKFAKTRILRSLKNRFGPVDEVGIFLMEGEGMTEAKNPEQLFLASKNSETPGSVLVSTLEGSRAFLVELQALVVSTRLPLPRRVVSGMDPRRVELLLAVLQKHCHLPVDSMDVFVNVAGGLKLADPGVDLGVCLAVVSSLRNISLPSTVGIAEVGLLGELRMVPGLEKRVREAEKLGFKNIITAKTHKTLKEVITELGK